MICIGVDFDNTIVCYDEVFHKVALEQRHIPERIPVSKTLVRDYLRESGKEDVWTEMQGYVYGKRMQDAELFPDIRVFFQWAKISNIPVMIISHKTRFPYRGPKYDLHDAAEQWLESQGFFDEEGIGLRRENVFFKLTKAEKLKCIGEQKCTYFIDDLPEFLTEPDFPKNVSRILFDPNENYSTEQHLRRVRSWKDILEIFQGGTQKK